MTAISVSPIGRLPEHLLDTDPGELVETVEFLRELARVRRLPITAPLAFNALAFAFDLDSGHYRPELLDLDTLPVIATNEVVDPLPVGALARLAGGSRQMCEVVFRHGEHEALRQDGECPPWLSGAPAGAHDPNQQEQHRQSNGLVLSERLVIDATALGPGQPTRLRRMFGRALNRDGHLLVRTSYSSDEQAELDDTRLYVSYLLRNRAAELRDALRPVGRVEDIGNLADTLHAVFDVLSVLLASTGLLQWRDHYLHHDVYHRWAAGDQETRGVDPDSIDRFIKILADKCLPPQRRRYGTATPRPSYLAIGPMLRNEYPDPENPELPTDALRGPHYATTLVCSQLYMARRLEEEYHGRVPLQGFDVHVRLDDAWQGGGVWRSELASPAVAGLTEEVDLPLALGWLGATLPEQSSIESPLPVEKHRASPESVETAATAEEATATVESTAEIEERLEQEDGVAIRDQHVDDTTLGWQFVLGPRHIAGNLLPVTATVAEVMRVAVTGDSVLHLDISHPEIEPRLRRQRVRFNGRALVGLDWPEDMFCGMRLNASWSTDGFQIKMASTALAEPVDVNGIPIDYLFDEATLLRYLADPVDLEMDDEVLTMAALRGHFRHSGLRVQPRGNQLFMPLTTVVRAVRDAATARGEQVPTARAVCDALCEFAGRRGAIQVGWSKLLHYDDGDGDWLSPRVPCEPTREWMDESCVNAEPMATDLAVVLTVAPTPADRPSRAPAPDSGVSRSGMDFLRRGHLRRLPSGQTPKQRDLAIALALSRGMDPKTLSPTTTFVSESRPRSKRSQNKPPAR